MKKILFGLSLCATLLTIKASSNDQKKALINPQDNSLSAQITNEQKTVEHLLSSITRSLESESYKKININQNWQSFFNESNELNKPILNLLDFIKECNTQNMPLSSQNLKAICQHRRNTRNKIYDYGDERDLTHRNRFPNNAVCRHCESCQLEKKEHKWSVQRNQVLLNALFEIHSALVQNAQIKAKKETKDLYTCNLNTENNVSSYTPSIFAWLCLPFSGTRQLCKIHCCPLDSYQD